MRNELHHPSSAYSASHAGQDPIQSERRFRALIENSSDGIALVSGNGTIEYVSPSITRILGYSVDELLGRNFLDLVHPDELEATRTMFLELLQKPTGASQNSVTRFRNKQGEWRLLDGIGANRMADPDIRAIVCNFRDITHRVSTERALSESEKRFLQFADNVKDVVWMVDRDVTQIVYINQAYETVWGRSCDSLRHDPRSFVRAVHPDDRAGVLRKIERQQQSQFGIEEYRIVRPNGSIRWIRDRSFPIRDEQGNVHSISGIAEDITERKQTVDDLRESEACLRQITENLELSLGLVDSKSQKLLYINKAYETIWGRSRASLYEDSQSFLDAVHPDDLHIVQRMMQEQMVGRSEIKEYRILRPDGSVRWLRGRAFPIYDSDHRIYRSVGMAEDITNRKEAEDRLLESEKRFREIAEKLPQVLWMVDARSHRLLYINEAYETVWGHSCASLYENTPSFLDTVHPDDRERIERMVRDQRQGIFKMEEYRIVRPDGTIRWIRSRAFPIKDSQGNFYRFAGIAADITVSKQVEEALRDRETRLRLLLEQMPAILWSTDVDLKITSGVGRGLEVLDLKTNQLNGMSLFDYLRTSDTEFPPIRAHLDALAGHSVKFPTVWKDRHFQSYVEPLRDGDGKIMGTVGVALDVTDLQESREKLRLSDEYTREIISSVSEGIIVYDDELRYQVWNPFMERLTGRTADEVKGKHPEEVFPFLKEQGVIDLIQRAFDGEDVHAPDVRFEIPDTGKSGWSSPKFVPLHAADGKIRGVLGTIHDVTERKQTQEQLRDYSERLQALSRRLMTAQEDERHRLARELHDEISQVLAAIIFHLYAAKKVAGTSAQHSLDQSITAVNTAVEQVRDMSLALRPLMLDDLGLESALRWYVGRHERLYEVSVDLDSDLDSRRLPAELETACFRIAQQALTNIARHAQARNVKIRLQMLPKELKMMIKDDGIGFDVAAALQRAVAGGGFGLLGMRERAQLLGGNLAISSSPGKGTVLTATFPLAVETLESPTRKAAAR